MDTTKRTDSWLAFRRAAEEIYLYIRHTERTRRATSSWVPPRDNAAQSLLLFQPSQVTSYKLQSYLSATNFGLQMFALGGVLERMVPEVEISPFLYLRSWYLTLIMGKRTQPSTLRTILAKSEVHAARQDGLAELEICCYHLYIHY